MQGDATPVNEFMDLFLNFELSGEMNMRVVLLVIAGAMVVGNATAVDVPKLKSGLWELSSTSSKVQAKGHPTSPMKSCVDDATQQEMMNFGRGMRLQMCSRNEVRNEGSKLISESECQMGNTKMKSRGVTTFSGNSSYHIEVHTTYDPPLRGSKDSMTVMEGKHVGPCPAGMKPGDVEVDGKRTNIIEMKARAGN